MILSKHAPGASEFHVYWPVFPVFQRKDWNLTFLFIYSFGSPSQNILAIGQSVICMRLHWALSGLTNEILEIVSCKHVSMFGGSTPVYDPSEGRSKWEWPAQFCSGMSEAIQIHCILNTYDSFRVTYIYIKPAFLMLNFPWDQELISIRDRRKSFMARSAYWQWTFWSTNLFESNYMLLILTFLSEWYSLGGLFHLTFSLSRQNLTKFWSPKKRNCYKPMCGLLATSQRRVQLGSLNNDDAGLRGRRLEKKWIYILQAKGLFSTPMTLKTPSGKICNDSVHVQMQKRKISRRRPGSVDGAELGHFTLLFCRGQQRNVQKVITHVRSYCFAH